MKQVRIAIDKLPAIIPALVNGTVKFATLG